MNPIKRIFDAVTTLFGATARLKRAERATEPPGYPGTRPQLPRPMPPPRPLGHSGYPGAVDFAARVTPPKDPTP